MLALHQLEIWQVHLNRNKIKLIIFRIHCAVIKAVHSLTYGDRQRDWVGVEPLKDKLVLFNAQLSAFFATTADTFPSEPAWSGTSKELLKADSVTLKEDTLSVTGKKCSWIYQNDPVNSLPDGFSRISIYFSTVFPT